MTCNLTRQILQMVLLSSVWGSIGEAVGADVGPRRAASTVGVDSASGSGGSFAPIFSADGQHIVFISHANNLVTNDSNDFFLDVFVRDLVAGTTRLVSVQPSGRGGGNGNSFEPSVSSNGQFIAFQSEASNLAAGDENGASDVFLRDVTAGTTVLVSVNRDGTGSGNGAASSPQVSADGRFVIFESRAGDLVANDTNGLSDVFVRDLVLGTTELVSVDPDGMASGNGASDSPSISADGHFVAFVSTASDLVAVVTNPLAQIYIRDTQSRTTTCASAGIRQIAQFGFERYHSPMIASDGGYLAFKGTRSSGTIVYHHDRAANTNRVVSAHWTFQGGGTGTYALIPFSTAPEGRPLLTPDGRFVAYVATNPPAAPSAMVVFKWDLQDQTNRIMTLNPSGSPASHSILRVTGISADGYRLSLLSDSGDLATNSIANRQSVYLRDDVASLSRIISLRTNGTVAAELDGIAPAISADGMKVAFDSSDAGLAVDDRNQMSDVFVSSASTELLQLISERANLMPSVSGPGTSWNRANSISDDNRIVTFIALDGNWVQGDTNGQADVFARDILAATNVLASYGPSDSPLTNRLGAVIPTTNRFFLAASVSANGRWVLSEGGFAGDVFLRDLNSGQIVLVSATVDGNPSGNSASASISADGRYVVFDSASSQLTSFPSHPFQYRDVFLYDVNLRSNAVVSTSWLIGAGSVGDADSFKPLISRNGHWIVYQSKATGLTGGTVNSPFFQLYARDLTILTNQNRLLSMGANAAPFPGNCTNAIFSANSRFLAFLQAPSTIYVHDLIAWTNQMICTNCAAPGLSGDGRVLVYETLPGVNNPRQIRAFDRQTAATTLLSVNQPGTGGGNNHSRTPVISADGRFVVFASRASDLVDNDTNKFSDIFVRDLVATNTMLVSLNVNGTGSGNRASFVPLLAADGRTVVFHSFASDLVANDFNDNRDIFVLRLSAGDSDGDGLDDDWEMAYFGNLARDGSDDFDGDGSSDRAEFLAGTDPTNGGSILRVLTLTAPGSASTTVIWSAVPGRRYQAQFKNNVDDASWTDVGGPVSAVSATASQVDTTAGGAGQRFYRVILQP